MLSLEIIKNITINLQTTEVNIIREYIQHLFLNYLYQTELSEKLFFKGGTALRLVYNGPRFSEDLDFSSLLSPYKIKNLIVTVVKKLSEEQIKIVVEESKPTSGGYLGILTTTIYDTPIRIELNISLRRGRIKGETVLATNQFIPAYTLNILAEEQMIQEKIDALLTRAKPRDYFDLYFIIRNRIGIKQVLTNKNKVLKIVKSADDKELKRELKMFLPRSYWGILNNLKELLLKEVERL